MHTILRFVLKIVNIFKDKIFYSLIRTDHYIITILNPYVLYALSIAKRYLY